MDNLSLCSNLPTQDYPLVVEIPIVIILYKPNKETKIFTLKGKTLENVLHNIVVCLKKEIDMKIDYPDDIDTFSNLHWFDTNDNVELFNYHIFNNNMWSTPWTQQEIYENILELINELDVQNALIDISNDESCDSDEED
jgi:hypothetical protein